MKETNRVIVGDYVVCNKKYRLKQDLYLKDTLLQSMKGKNLSNVTFVILPSQEDQTYKYITNQFMKKNKLFKYTRVHNVWSLLVCMV